MVTHTGSFPARRFASAGGAVIGDLFVNHNPIYYRGANIWNFDETGAAHRYIFSINDISVRCTSRNNKTGRIINILRLCRFYTIKIIRTVLQKRRT
jgi:hypothetical protein